MEEDQCLQSIQEIAPGKVALTLEIALQKMALIVALIDESVTFRSTTSQRNEKKMKIMSSINQKIRIAKIKEKLTSQ